MATKEMPPEFASVCGFGINKRAAVRSLRENIAMRVQARISPGPTVIFDEMNDVPESAWEQISKRMKK